MLTVIVPEKELFDEETGEFIYTKDQVLVLEHSLVSLSKWESKWKVPFLADNNKTTEQWTDYIKCMTITQNVPDNIYHSLTLENYKDINSYIQDSMTATTFTEHSKPATGHNGEIITSEVIYYWMTALSIPIECQKWHLNRLLTLVRICNIKNTPPKKMSTRDIINNNAALNAARRKKFNSRG